jgi:hypothetical protein
MGSSKPENLAEPPPLPRSTSKQDLGFEQQPMVGWFDPVRLLKIVVQVIVSTMFGNYSDKREIQAALGKQEPFDYSAENEIWFDYIADLGDGWNPTYTLARILASEEITINDKQGNSHPTARGRFLVMGGDEVYPSADRDSYRNRTEGPYRAALPWLGGDNQTHLFAIPGNHDWYDGLTSFTRLFCQNRWIGAWKTRQSRSYFAIQLPHNWWIFAVDIQLGADIDKPQVEYFDEVIAQVSDGDRVIFVSATPSWITASLTGDVEHENITFLERRVERQNATIVINLAGDLHHYAHYQNQDKSRHKFTAGGGGAFMHYTHTIPGEIIVNEASGSNEYKLGEDQLYPSRKTSRKLLTETMQFFLKNKSMSIFLGCYYLFVLWVTQSASLHNSVNLLDQLIQIPVSWSILSDSLESFTAVLIHNPSSAILFAIYIFAFIGFCEPALERNKTAMLAKRILVGSVHGILHVLLMMTLTLFFAKLNPHLADTALGSIHPALLWSIEIVAIGGILAGILMGIYLFLANRLLGFHMQGAASCNRIEDYKNFLRFNIDPSGKLTIYPMGIDKVEKKWLFNNNAKAGDPWFVPASAKAMSDYLHLIEAPIEIDTVTGTEQVVIDQ